ncbi:MAG: hypothetical protein ACW99R_18185 [Candidatus Hodarchaeales archaeon]|jgi:hypothetical protein
MSVGHLPRRNANKEGNWVTQNQFKIKHYMKVVFVGLGATPVFKRHLEDFDEEKSLSWHIGIVTTAKTLSFLDKEIKLKIWNLRSGPEYTKVRKMFMQGSLGLVIFFQQNNQESFVKVPTFFNDFKKHSRETFSKAQLHLINLLSPVKESRQVSSEEAVDLASSLGMVYYEMQLEDEAMFSRIFTALGEAVVNNVQK